MLTLGKFRELTKDMPDDLRLLTMGAEVHVVVGTNECLTLDEVSDPFIDEDCTVLFDDSQQQATA